jgi:hypothetical protein
MDDGVKNKRKAFFVGGNSGCRVHARSHFAIYKECCETAQIKLHHHTLPQKLFRAMKQEELKGKRGVQRQSTLDTVVVKEKKAEDFSHSGILQEIAKFIACDDQVSPSLLNQCRLTRNCVTRH